MLKVYNCIATAHDLKLVALAALICALASFDSDQSASSRPQIE